MDLFNQIPLSEKNYLPHHGTVNYYGPILPNDKAVLYYNYLLSSMEWKNDEAFIFGKRIITKRKVAWYGDLPYEYTYSNNKKSFNLD